MAVKDLYMIDIPVKDMDDPRHKTTTMRVPMILPHELLEFLIVPGVQLYFFGLRVVAFKS